MYSPFLVGHPQGVHISIYIYKYITVFKIKQSTLLEVKVPSSKHLVFYSTDLTKTKKSHLLRMRGNLYKFGCDCSIKRGTIVELQRTLFEVLGNPFKRSH
jgi:hypothetical protein